MGASRSLFDGRPGGGLDLPDGSQDERELVERAKRDPDAFGALYDRYFPQIYRFAYSRLREQSLAEDVTQEVFFKALRNMGRYTYSGHPFSSWLYQIALNAVADHYRGQRGEVELEEATGLASQAPEVVDEVIRRDRSHRVWTAIDQLPRQQRAAMVLKFGEDRKIDEIAQILGKSSGAVKLLLHRGVERLRRELPQLEAELGTKS
ncbi:MAG: sigma-70 family RNA polymerase sigma factor [Chloroflexi bacterium]|nr:MAG: sigma-70 family RNA polymerase sigma factor [Chloroflexota bacterium]TMG37669.1 MAG: sigma-70 family RNA polymerase sigma factor [Chloroflexota bacterium]